jgi:hypothetical protein
LLVIGAVGATGLPSMAASAAPSAKVAAVHGSPGPQAVQPAPGLPAGAKAVGAVRPSATISADLVLKPRDNAAVTRFIAQVTDKNSPMFHHYLPAGAFANRFGPAKATISRAVALLKADGLRVTSVSRDGLLIHFAGTSKAIGNAFRTKLENYRLRDGFLGRATTSAVKLPGPIAGSVAAVLGLNDLVRLQPEGIKRAPAQDRAKIHPARTARFAHPAGAPVACKAATSAATAFGGLTDDQIANAYGATGLYGSADFGAGQHIALYELEPFARSDVKAFDTCFFGATAAAQMLTRLHTVAVDGGQPPGSGSGESILDVEDLSGLAPGATIDVYTGPSPGSDGLIYDPVDPYSAMINADTDQVISTSWGLCEQAIETGQPGLQVAENELFEQAAAQGQSVFSAAGDNGSDDCNTFETSTPIAGQNPISEDDPSGQPYVVAVGGTTIDDASSAPPLEHVWNDGATEGGGGGGISQSWVMPSWQANATVPGIDRPGGAAYAAANQVEQSFGFPQGFCSHSGGGAPGSTPCRLVPDVSAQADQFTGAITIFQAVFGGWSTIGGTSSATPIWAAMLALVNASSTCTSNLATADGVGFASPLLYEVASNSATYKASFNDIRTGNNDLYGLDNGKVFNATKGYDVASGLGSPRLTGPGGSAGLAFSLCSLAGQATRPVVTGLNPTQGTVDGGDALTITGTGFESAGVPDVASIQIGNAVLDGSNFQVVNGTTITTTTPSGFAALPPSAPAPQIGAGPANVIVTLTGDVSSRPSPASTFEYVELGTGNHDVPTVTGVVPVAGPQTKPKPVTILGADFHTATSVKFGGVAATHFTIDSDNEITATPPPLSNSTFCSPLPSDGVYAGDTALNDICQVNVAVGNSAHTSTGSVILPPDQGPVTLNTLGVLVPPAGCGCEIQQQPTEYDYVPAPSITSVSTSSSDAGSMASEKGNTVITIQGAGLDPLTIDWANFGPDNQAFSQNTNFVFMTGTELQITAPAQSTTTDPLAVPFSIKTLGGTSTQVNVTYAGVPKVTGVVNTKNSSKLAGVSGAVDTGGAPLSVTGSGFANQLTVLEFTDPTTPFSTGTQYMFHATGDTGVTAQSVQQDPALTDVRACTVTGCSKAVKTDKLWVYPPGKPSVTSVSPSSGPAAGGTKVTIDGHNLGCPIGVFFGTTAAKSFAKVPGLLDCGATNTVTAVSPKGRKGTKVTVSVETVGSFFSHTGHGTTNAHFTYK